MNEEQGLFRINYTNFRDTSQNDAFDVEQLSTIVDQYRYSDLPQSQG